MAENTIKQNGKNPLGSEKISKLLMQFSIPSIISMLVNALYNIVDQVFIGNYIGVLGNAATNVAFPITTICTALSLLIGIGSASNFNLRLGEGNKDEASVFVSHGISLSLIFGIVLALFVGFFTTPLLYGFGSTDAVMVYALPYTEIITLGIPFLIFSTVASTLIRADGSPKYAMACILSGAIFNIIFDPIFMISLDMGIEGIAWATTIGQMLSSAVAFFYFFRFKSVKLRRKNFRPRGAFVKKILALGSASCFNQLAMTVVQIALNNVLTYYGAMSVYGAEAPLAAVGVITKVNIVYLSFSIGTAQGSQPIVGFNYGAKKYARVRETYKLASRNVLIIGLAAFLLFQFLPRQLTSLFGDGDAMYYQFAENYFRIFMMMTIINGIQPITSNFFTSIGKSHKGIFISLTRQILFLLPLVIVLPIFFGIDGVMYAGPIADAASALVAVLYILREMKELKSLERVYSTA